MKIICAPDSFKESLTAAEAARAMARGVKSASPHTVVDTCPIADGGEGTVEALVAATLGRTHTTSVAGPLGQWVDAAWGMLGVKRGDPTTAVIEMAAAAGLALVPMAQRDPTRTSTFGVGMLIRAALDAGARRIIMGIGGSATNDGGCGMAMALDAGFFDATGRPLSNTTPTGGMLGQIGRIDVDQLDPRIADTQITVACDVTNPLTGPNGASYIYGPQKGGTPAQIKSLDKGMSHLADLFRDQLDKDVATMPGAGASGGLGAGLVAFLGATLRPGIEIVLDAVDFDARVAGCDLCLTGEGRIDGTSLSGKACLGVAQRAQRQGVDTIALVGSIGPDADRTLDAGLKAYHAIGDGLTQEESIRRAVELIERSASDIVSTHVAND